MKRILAAIIMPLLLLCSCAQTMPETPAEPQRYETFRDECAVIYALPATAVDGGCSLELTVENVGQEEIVLSSVLCLSAQDEYGSPVEITSSQGLDGIIMPGESLCGTVCFARENLDGCVVSVALDFAAGRWVALNLI